MEASEAATTMTGTMTAMGTLGRMASEDNGKGGNRGGSNCNGNAGSADSGIWRGGKGLIPIPAVLDNLPPSLLLF